MTGLINVKPLVSCDLMADEVRVLHLITRFLDGGAETTTINELEAIREADLDADLRLGVGREHDEEALDSVEAQGVETQVFSWIRHYSLVASVLAVAQVARYLLRDDIDIVHTHSTEAGVIGRFAATIARTPVVVHEVHGDPIADDRSRLLNGFVLAMERLAARTTDYIVTKSPTIERCYLERGIGRPERYRVIRHGVDLERFRGASPASDLDPDRDVVMYVGRLARGKGIPDLLDAVAGLADDDVTLVLVGDGPLRSEIEGTVARRGMEVSVRLLGHREDVPSLLAAADLLVLPSYREGTPRVVTEALASGLPVIGTTVGGVPDQLDPATNGYLIDAGEVEALTATIRSVLADDVGPVETAHLDRYSLARSRERHRELYEELVREVRG